MENDYTSPKSDKNINKETNNDVILHLNLKSDIKLNLSDKTTLTNIRAIINQKCFMGDDEYEIYIKDNKIDSEPNSANVLKLLEKYKSNVIYIKTPSNTIFLIYISLLLLIIFHLTINYSSINRKITVLVQENALLNKRVKDLEKNNKNE